MNREEYIKHKISERGHTIKSFAKEIGMPYSTLLSMLNGSIGGASIDNVIKICAGLEITVNDLQAFADTSETSFFLSRKEKNLVIAYRSKPEMQAAVDTILNVHDDGVVSDIISTMSNGEKIFGCIRTDTK